MDEVLKDVVEDFCVGEGGVAEAQCCPMVIMIAVKTHHEISKLVEGDGASRNVEGDVTELKDEAWRRSGDLGRLGSRRVLRLIRECRCIVTVLCLQSRPLSRLFAGWGYVVLGGPLRPRIWGHE